MALQEVLEDLKQPEARSRAVQERDFGRLEFCIRSTASLQQAVTLWWCDNTYATTWFGDVASWDTSSVDTMDQLYAANGPYFSGGSFPSPPLSTVWLVTSSGGVQSALTASGGLLQMKVGSSWKYVCDDYFDSNNNGVNVVRYSTEKIRCTTNLTAHQNHT